MRPAPYLQRLGAVVADGIASAYNGLHLRLEKDAGYVRRVGGIEVGTCSIPSHKSLHPHLRLEKDAGYVRRVGDIEARL